MEGLGLAIYILMWPVVAAVVLAVIWRASYREFKAARRGDEDLV
jgi:hypothetical protein